MISYWNFHHFTGILISAAFVLAPPAVIGQGPMPQTTPSVAIVRGGPASQSISSGSAALTAIPEDFSKLRIAPGFLLHLDVYDIPELSSDLRVDANGKVSVPLAGAIAVGGLTLSEAREAIQTKLQTAEIIKHPQVILNIRQYAPFVIGIVGEVQNPGRLQLLAPHSLLDIISQSGGVTALAGNQIQVRHTAHGITSVKTYPYTRSGNGDRIASVMIHNGDTVIIPRAGIVYVLGAVNRPGGYLMQEDGHLNVAQALSLAAGTSLQAKIGDVRVVRRNANGTIAEIPIDYKAISKGKQRPLQLQAEDIVYVPISKIKAVLTSGASVIGQTASATIYAVR